MKADEETGLPTGWRWSRLGEHIRETTSGLASGVKSTVEGVPHLRMNNISVRGTVDLSQVWRIPISKEDLHRYRLERGDVLFNNTNSLGLVGKTALFDIDGEFVFSNHLTRIRLKGNSLRPEWLLLYLRFQWGRGYFEHVADEWVNQANVSDDVLRRLPIPMPLDETFQLKLWNQFSTQFDATERIRMVAQRQLEAARALPHALLRDLFGSFTPELDDHEIW